MKSKVGFLWLNLFASCSANAQSIDAIEVIEYGLFKSEITERADAPSVATGKFSRVTDFTNVEVTRTIPALLGVEFGFRYKILGAPNGADVPLTIVDRFPEQGFHKPDASETFYQEEYVETQPIGAIGYAGYGFSKSWELVPGVWTIEIWYKARKLAEQNFTVTTLTDRRSELLIVSGRAVPRYVQ